jgi:hypothetical protein
MNFIKKRYLSNKKHKSKINKLHNQADAIAGNMNV